VNLYSKCTRALTFENISLQDTWATQTQMERPRRNNPHLMFVGEFAPTHMERPTDTWQASLNVRGSPHVHGHVRTNRRRNRRGCGQTWGEHRPMPTCSGCRVARFCSADHQKMASKKAAFGRSLTLGGTRIFADHSKSGARLSRTVWRLTRALRTWWRFCSDAPRHRGSARASSLRTGVQGVAR
jgi:hypothetical protein